ncbi:TerD family protein [Streptomyces mayteni]
MGNGGVSLGEGTSAPLTHARGRVLSDDHFVFLDNPKSPDGTVEHCGDELVGSTDSATGGAGEEINVDLTATATATATATEVDRIVFPPSIHKAAIHEAAAGRQNPGPVSDAYIRTINQADGREPARHDPPGQRGIALDYGVNA